MRGDGRKEVRSGERIGGEERRRKVMGQKLDHVMSAMSWCIVC